MAAIMDWAILHKTNFTHSFWLNLMMAANLYYCQLEFHHLRFRHPSFSSSRRFTQKLSHSNVTLIQTYSTSLKLIHSHLTWWWKPICILPSWIQPICTKKTSLIHSVSNWWWQPSWILSTWIQPFCTKKTSLIHSDSTWWWQPSWNLPSLIQPFCTKKLHSFILTQIDDGSHIEFCYVGFRHCHLRFRHLVFFSQIHSINTLTPFWLWHWLKLVQSDSNSFFLT